MGNGLPPARAPSGAPRSRPNHKRSPEAVLGPSQIFRMASASGFVRHVAAASPSLHTSVAGSYEDRPGSSMMPALTPSALSQAAVAAPVAGVRLSRVNAA